MQVITKKELLGGVSTFFTVFYLLILYPKIFHDVGIDFGACYSATLITIFFATCFLALWSDFPALLVPGLSVGPYLAYSVISVEGASISNAFGMVFWTGVIIFLLSIFKIRQKILQALPESIKSAAIGGIGLFLISIGLKHLLPHNHWINLENGTFLFAIFLFFTLFYFKIRLSYLITLFSSILLAYFFGAFSVEKVVSLPASLQPTFFKLDFLTPLSFDWIGTTFSITLICLFDTSGSLYALAQLANRCDANGQIRKVDQIVIPDGPGSCLASILGTGTLTFALESAAGINIGARGKLCAITAATLCLIALFFSPLLGAIPLFATMPLLVIIGSLMAFEARHSLRIKNYSESIPSWIMLIVIPLRSSIYEGFALGFVSFVLLKGLKRERVHPICWTIAVLFLLHTLLFYVSL